MSEHHTEACAHFGENCPEECDCQCHEYLKRPVQEEERDVVVALRFKTFSSPVHMQQLFERIRRYLAVELQHEVELAGYAYSEGDTEVVSALGPRDAEVRLNPSA